MGDAERELLNKELLELAEKVKGEFVSSKDMRRMDEITSLLMTNGESKDIKFKFVKGRGGKMGMNTKGYNNKGPVG